MRTSVEARAAQLVDAWLRGYYSRRPLPPPLGLEELADLAHAAREAAERQLAELEAPRRQS